MTFSSSWVPDSVYSPNDKRFSLISTLIQEFNEQLQRSSDKAKKDTRIVGSSTWIWFLKNLKNPQDTEWLDYFNATVDIDVSNKIYKKTKVQDSTHYFSLINLARYKYPEQFVNPPFTTQTDYQQITFLLEQSIDWTNTIANFAPLHNFDAYAVLEGEDSVRFHFPYFDKAKDSRDQRKFLLNPFIFSIDKYGVPRVNLEERCDKTPMIPFMRTQLTNKMLACAIKTICKLSTIGIALDEDTLTYLTALANTPTGKNENILFLRQTINGTILQSALNSFFVVQYKNASNDDKYIYEKALQAMIITVGDKRISLYQIFVDTIQCEHGIKLLSTPKWAITEPLRKLFPESAPLPSAETVQDKKLFTFKVNAAAFVPSFLPPGPQPAVLDSPKTS